MTDEISKKVNIFVVIFCRVLLMIKNYVFLEIATVEMRSS